MKRSNCILLMLVLFFFSCTATKQVTVTGESTEQASLEQTDILPVDAAVTLGKLDNGLKYYIRENHKPEKRMELRLVVKAGSVLEDENQRGLAHFTEHMAFNGTKNFRKQELVDYLESIGMRFGPDLNAYTSFDETVYMLQVPVDSVQIVEKAFQILEDWAHNISFEDEEIDRERGVIVEEWRSGRGASARIRDKQLPVLFKDSRYAERMPIGKMEVVETFPHDTLRSFYRDWYRPDLLTVIAVGDFDTKWIEEQIQKHFSRIPSSNNPRERVVFQVPDHEETLFAIASDPEATGNSVSVYYKHDITPEVTVDDYRDGIVEALYNGMLNQRLHELTKKSDPPFLYGYSSKGRFVLSREIYMLGAGVKDNGIERGLETLVTEAARVRKYGFTQSELERRKKEMLRYMESAYNERDKTESRNYASEYARNFVMDEPIPGIEFEYNMYRKYIPDITLEEVNRLTGEWMTDRNRVIMADVPEKAGVNVPTEEKLLAVINAVNKKDIEPYVDTVSDQPLVESPPVPSSVVEENRIEEVEVTEWLLANGVRVILKPTDFKNDEILFTSFSPGGISLVPDEYHMAGETASSVVQEGGVGKFGRIELEKMLSGKVVSVSPWINDLREGISGSASPKDVETMFQLIYLYFTSPRKDDIAFQSFKTRMKGYIENRNARPESALSDTVTVTMAQYHRRERPLSMELLDEMNLDMSYEIYRDRFRDASDFTFVFIGNFEQSQLKPLVET
ncbi:MAG: insulinase family protein, partial [Candidatus Latescibacteria bacterium]|nr:insulinase family protein [Candidatus Latescibacterota bacterium]